MDVSQRLRWIRSACDWSDFSECSSVIGNDAHAVYFEGPVTIEDQVKLLQNACAFYAGAHTSMLGNSDIAPFVTIGRYCSISFNVTLGSGWRHPDYLSTGLIPGQDLAADEIEEMHAACDAGDVGAFTRIGCDVWIGANVSVLQGCSVGHGACLGAGAVVTDDVPPYAIMVGNPARVVRYRFAEPVIDSLLRTRWWTLAEDMIKNLPFKDIERCVDVLEEIRFG